MCSPSQENSYRYFTCYFHIDMVYNIGCNVIQWGKMSVYFTILESIREFDNLIRFNISEFLYVCGN